MMRLPHLQSAAGLMSPRYACHWTSVRHCAQAPVSAPREIRAELGDDPPLQHVHRRCPFDSAVGRGYRRRGTNTFNLLDAVRIIEEAYDDILEHNVILPIAGWRPLNSLPCRSCAPFTKSTARSAWHIDAHADVNDRYVWRKIRPRHHVPPRRCSACWTVTVSCKSACAPSWHRRR